MATEEQYRTRDGNEHVKQEEEGNVKNRLPERGGGGREEGREGGREGGRERGREGGREGGRGREGWVLKRLVHR